MIEIWVLAKLSSSASSLNPTVSFRLLQKSVNKREKDESSSESGLISIGESVGAKRQRINQSTPAEEIVSRPTDHLISFSPATHSRNNSLTVGQFE